MKKKRSKRIGHVLYVAVVVSGSQIRCGVMESCRVPFGDWASFIGNDKDEVVRRALEAVRKWGQYQIWIGTLTDEVVVPTNFKLVKL
jgi:hypothetical protein